jgi:hypothetical protein
MKIAAALNIILIVFITSCKKESALINDTGSVFNFITTDIDSGINVGDIYSSKNFAAFTDVCYYNNLWYSVFRVGTEHAGGEDGQIKIITSSDGIEWKVMNNISVGGFDLRDPKLTIDSVQNILHLSFFGRNVSKRGNINIENYITQLNVNTNSWGTINKIEYNTINNKQYVFWRYTYHNAKMYCIAYQYPVGIDSVKNLRLFISDNNFSNYKFLANLNLAGSSSETTLRFASNDSMYIIARTETISTPIGISLPNFVNTSWINHPLSTILASPNFLFYKNKLLITGRNSQDHTFKFFAYDLSSKTVQKVYTFPSGYETGYGGMSFNPKNQDELWVTYYSITNSASTIKLARIDLTKFL